MGNTPRQLAPAMVLLMTALALCGVARYPGWPNALLYYLAGALLIAASAFLASTMVALSPRGESARVGVNKRRAGPPPRRGSRTSRHIQAVLTRAQQLVASAPLPTDVWAILTTVGVSALGLFALMKGWQTPDPTPAAMLAPAAGVLVALVFPLLVLERYLAGMPPQSFPDSAMLARLCRVPIVALLGLGIASFLRWLDLASVATLVEHTVAVLIALVGIELILRGITAWYGPRAAAEPQRCPADSTIAGMLRWQRPDFAGLSAGVSRHFGIDLSRSWALGFIRRAALPFVLGLAACSWLLTGVSALSSSERAVYESFGRPVGVFRPGLHLHLPWPLGVLRPVEFGTVHELPIVFGTNEASAATTAAPAPAANIEGAAPASADRLWDASHPSEASYLVASRSNGQQNFEVINIDLRVLYRVGLSDAAAQEVTYNVTTPDAVIQAAAGRMLARYFARYTLWDVLGQNREAFIQGFQQGLQARVAELSTGIEIMGIVVEAIHPPAAAAGAYEGVQTAAIRSVVQIARAKAEAARTLNEAQSAATLQHNGALAAATELTDQAKTELALFAGDRRAYESGGTAFLLERRLQHFNKALSGASFTVVDHRIDRADAPVLDLRLPTSGSPTSFPPND